MAMNSPWDERHWMRTPIAVRHSQTFLLVITLIWGLSYVQPAYLRIPWSEVFPPDLQKWSFIPMWGYGAGMITGCVGAFVGERMIIMASGMSKKGWVLSFLSHAILAAIYFTLAAAALVFGLRECGGLYWSGAAVISALSRPCLWVGIGYMHLTFARLPPPDFPSVTTGKHRPD
jgi:hypothetical protein